MPRRLEAPVFFTSAAKVKIPFVGDDTRAVKLIETQFYPISNPLEKHHNEVSKHFVRLVSNDVRFNDDVILERCKHSLPYKSHDFSGLYTTNLLSSKAVKKTPNDFPGRFESRGYNRKPPGHLKKLYEPPVFKRSSEEQKRDLLSEAQSSVSRRRPHFMNDNDAFAELIKRQIAEELKLADKPYMSSSLSPNDWDEVILDSLSKDTSHWIVYEALPGGSQKEKLGRFLRDKYGEKLSNTHIVRAEASESDLRKLKKSRKEEIKREHDLRRMESAEERRQEIRCDKLYKKSIAEYYKLPRFLTQQHSKVITTSSEVNDTARNIKVKHLVHSPPPKMEDFLNKAAGKYIKSTENEFEQQLYTGQAKPVHQKFGDRSRVVMDDLSEYKVDVRPKYPLNPNSWVQRGRKPKEADNKYGAKGLQRWMRLPQPADFMSERGLNPPKSEEAQIEHVQYNKLDSMVNNLPLITLVEEWRSKWKLVGQWQDIPISDILIDMESLHDHIRLGAVAACAMASLHKKPINDITGLAVSVLPNNEIPKQGDDENNVGHLPEVLVGKVEEKLKDKNERVKLAAAICLYSLKSTDPTVFEILKKHMRQGYSSDRLAAAQCLALSNDISAEVIRMMVQLLLEKDNTPSSVLTANQRDQATMLLVSNNTTLVHSLLAEQLNSSSWKDRVIACQVLAKLTGNINKDLVRKLTNLMWHDWSSEVRKASAETLGRTGHGRDIHFELRNKLAQGNEIMRVNVLKKISHLGIMTAALLPAYMQCFTDQYVSVRMQACKTAGKLKLNDESIASELLRMMEFDPSWKIKAHAIKAIREIGFTSEKLHAALVWAMRFEDEAGVRMEACLALRNFYQNQVPDREVLHVLQDRALVEPDPLVKEEVQKTLEAFDTTSYGDNMDMIQQIKTEVRRLCNKGVIAAKIAMYERELEKYQNKVQYMGLDQDSLDDMRSSTAESDNRSVALGKYVNTTRPEIVVTPSTIDHRSPKSRPETRLDSRTEIESK